MKSVHQQHPRARSAEKGAKTGLLVAQELGLGKKKEVKAAAVVVGLAASSSSGGVDCGTKRSLSDTLDQNLKEKRRLHAKAKAKTSPGLLTKTLLGNLAMDREASAVVVGLAAVPRFAMPASLYSGANNDCTVSLPLNSSPGAASASQLLGRSLLLSSELCSWTQVLLER